MLQAALQHEKKKKLHSVVKESWKLSEEIGINTKPTKAARDIKKKAKNASFEDMKKRTEKETFTTKA